MRASPSRVGNGRDRPRPTRGGDAERTLSGPPPQAMRPGHKTTSRNNAARIRRHRPGQVIGLPCEPAGRLHVPVHDVGRRGYRVEASQVNSRRRSCPSSFGGRSDTARSAGACVRTPLFIGSRWKHLMCRVRPGWDRRPGSVCRRVFQQVVSARPRDADCRVCGHPGRHRWPPHVPVARSRARGSLAPWPRRRRRPSGRGRRRCGRTAAPGVRAAAHRRLRCSAG